MGTCFVVMGFGKKTDYATGRVLDLDQTYKWVIKPVVEECGLTCVRADEIRHSGIIDVPMYQQLLNADLVIADLSTSNANAMYELGVRHALRPHSTIVMAESRLVYPFDVNHTAILTYKHLEEEIGMQEGQRIKGLLKETVQAILGAQPTPVDSAVYTYLQNLVAPVQGAGQGAPVPVAGAAARPGTPPEEQAVSQLLAQAEAAIGQSDFPKAKALLEVVQAMKPADQPWTANDTSLVQRLALATYKSKLPTPQEALENAATLLQKLEPATSNDTETLGLWGAVQKRLWDLTHERPRLDSAIRAYERGFYLRNDYYNGINVAYLLNVRATESSPAEAVADFIQAERVRRQVVEICEAALAAEAAAAAVVAEPDQLVAAVHRPLGVRQSREEEVRNERRYWIQATLAEAWLGIGDTARGDQVFAEACKLPVPAWMIESTKSQFEALRRLLTDSPLRFVVGASSPTGAVAAVQ
jgi:hypothetical protein